MMNIENIGHRFTEIVNTPEWAELQEKYNKCDDIYVLGHGGNMGVADHTAVDMTRLSNGTKNAMCPGSCVVATSLINDTSFDQWMVAWLQQRTSTRTKSQMKKSLVYGISSSGKSKDFIAISKASVPLPTPKQYFELLYLAKLISKSFNSGPIINDVLVITLLIFLFISSLMFIIFVCKSKNLIFINNNQR